MNHVLSLVSVVTEAAAFTFAQATDPVCIVGAGPAWLSLINPKLRGTKRSISKRILKSGVNVKHPTISCEYRITEALKMN
jgi:hypothetical protein